MIIFKFVLHGAILNSNRQIITPRGLMYVVGSISVGLKTFDVKIYDDAIMSNSTQFYIRREFLYFSWVSKLMLVQFLESQLLYNQIDVTGSLTHGTFCFFVHISVVCG